MKKNDMMLVLTAVTQCGTGSVDNVMSVIERKISSQACCHNLTTNLNQEKAKNIRKFLSWAFFDWEERGFKCTRDLAQKLDVWQSLEEKLPDVNMPITQRQSIKNKIAELTASGLNSSEIARYLSEITKAELIRIIKDYQEG
jgi:hypothetical protein